MDSLQMILDSKDSKLNFMKGLALLSRVDGNTDENEIAFFTNAAMALGLSSDEQKLVSSYLTSPTHEAEVRFTDKKQALFFFREAIQLCHIDNSYDDREKKLIELFRSQNGVSPKAISQIEQWAHEGMTWRKRGEDLLEMEK